jgi:lipoprotein-releasing system ATP-binding protein
MTLVAKNLKKSFWQGDREIPVLQGVDLNVEAGETLAIVGASGIGKTTLLHCLGLLENIDGGELIIDHVEMRSLFQDVALEFRRKKIGFVFQFHYLMAELTALENVMMPLRIQNVPEKEARDRAENFLSKVGLTHRLSHRPKELSGGEQQRVSVARALVHEPVLIIADEPTGNLDPGTGQSVFELLVERAEGMSAGVVMATHNLVLAKKMKRTLSLSEGRLL